MFKILLFCQPYLFAYKWMLITYILLKIIINLLSLAPPYIIGNFIDQLLYNNNVKFIFQYFMLFSVISFSTLILGFITGLLYVNLQNQIGFNLNIEYIKKMQKSPLSFTQNQDTVYLNQRINNDSNKLIIFCINIIQNILTNFALIAIPLLIMFNFHSLLSFVLLFVSFSYFLFYLLFRKFLYKITLNFRESQSHFFAKLNEQLFNIRFIKLHSLFENFSKRLSKNFNNLMLNSLRYQKANYVFSGLDQVVTMVAQMVLLLIGGIEIINGRLSIGQFIIISTLFNKMIGAVRYFFGLGQNVQDNLVSYNRLQELNKIAYEPNGTQIVNEIHTIELKNISFSYGNEVVFQYDNIFFERGKIYGILGENGTGKSTMLDIIVGLQIGNYNGLVLYNGISMDKIDMYKLRENHIGVSEQEPTLIADTVAFNVSPLNENALALYNNKLDDLVDILGLNNYLNTLPNNINTDISENSANISGGEKQKLSILRTLVKNPDVVILDEPTSALDIGSKDKLRKYLVKISKNKIIIIVTHDHEFLDINNDIIIKLTSKKHQDNRVSKN